MPSLSSSFTCGLRQSCLATAVLLLTVTGARASAQSNPAGTTPAAAASQPPPGTPTTPPGTPPLNAVSGGTGSKADLKESVTILGATAANDTVTTALQSGTTLPLVLFVKAPPAGHANAALRALPFSSQAQPPVVAIARVQVAGSSGPAESVSVTLAKPGEIVVYLQFDQLRPATTYTGQLFVSSAELLHHWTITFVTGGRGVLAVDPVGTLRFVTCPPFTSVGPFAGT